MRRYDDPVDVRPAPQDPGCPQLRPEAFLWQDRLYVVREVLGHWRERRAWWTGTAAQALHGEGEASAGTATIDAERDVWRVEASRGRAYSVGVFDLGHEPSADPADPTGRWRLLGVGD